MIQNMLLLKRFRVEEERAGRGRGAESKKRLRHSCVAALLCALLGCAKPAPAPEPIPDVPPAPPPPIEHRVQYSGETLGLIARWYTGKTTNWEAIQAANPGLDPRRMTIGSVITIPRDLVVKEEPMPRSLVGAVAKTAPASPSSEAAQPEAEQAVAADEEALSASDEEIESETELSAEEKLRRDLEAALAAEMSGSPTEAAASKAVEAETVEAQSGTPMTEEVDTVDVPDTSAEEVDRERLLDELLAE